MGADLVGYLLKGPKRIDEEKQSAAIAQIKRVQELIQRITADDPDDDIEAATAEFQRLVFDRYRPMDTYDCVPEDLINEFVDLWETSASRDVVSGTDPDDKTQQIMFAGGTSYGDDPDGFGYQTIHMLNAFNGLTILGIK